MNKVDNSDAYDRIDWILENADMGFFLITAPPPMQREIAELYRTSRVDVYDYSYISGPYSFARLKAWVDSRRDIEVFFILNMQVALRTDEDMLALNMSRDILAKEQKIWFFCMTKDMDDRLATFAYDIYSYIRMKAHFQAEKESDHDQPQIAVFDQPHNYEQIQEMLSRYRELEEEYMSLPIEYTSDNQLLSAAISLSNISQLYMDSADYNNALKLLERIKDIREKVLGKEHTDTAATYNSIGKVYYRQRDYFHALEWSQKALDIRETVLGVEHPYTAENYNNIGEVYRSHGDYQQALEWHVKALAIREKVLGKKHPDTASTYNNIGEVCRGQGDYPQALSWHQKALDIREKVLGKEHPATVKTYNNIAGVYNRQGYYQQALEWRQKALDANENVLGKEHPETAIAYNNIAAAYYNQGDYPQALEWYWKALDVFEKALGPDHPSSKAVRENIEALPL